MQRKSELLIRYLVWTGLVVGMILLSLFLVPFTTLPVLYWLVFVVIGLCFAFFSVLVLGLEEYGHRHPLFRYIFSGILLLFLAVLPFVFSFSDFEELLSGLRNPWIFSLGGIVILAILVVGIEIHHRRKKGGRRDLNSG